MQYFEVISLCTPKCLTYLSCTCINPKSLNFFSKVLTTEIKTYSPYWHHPAAKLDGFQPLTAANTWYKWYEKYTLSAYCSVNYVRIIHKLKKQNPFTLYYYLFAESQLWWTRKRYSAFRAHFKVDDTLILY